MRSFKSNKRIYISIFVYILSIVSLAIYSYFQERNHIYIELDLKLKTAALTISSLLPDNFHQQDMRYDENSAQLNLNNRDALTTS